MTDLILFHDAAPPSPHVLALYMVRGCDAMHKMLGEKYAAKHPELLAAFVLACQRDIVDGVENDD